MFLMEDSIEENDKVNVDASNIVENETIKVEQLASDKKLQDLALFSVPFQFDSRISADEIHKRIVTNTSFQNRGCFSAVFKFGFFMGKLNSLEPILIGL